MQQPDDGWIDDSGEHSYKDVRAAIWNCHTIGASAKMVGLRLVEYGANAFPSLDTLAYYCELSKRTVRSALRELEREEVITTRRTGRSSRYSIFCGVRIPAFGRKRTPPPPSPPADDAPESGVSSSGVSSMRQNLPDSSSHTRAASSAAQSGNLCRTERQPLPPKQRSKLKSKQVVAARARAKRPAAAPPPPLFLDFDGWECSSELHAELLRLGITADRIAFRLNQLKKAPIKRGRGVPSLDDYVRDTAAGYWVKWELEDQNAISSGGNAVSRGFAGGGAPGGGLDWKPPKGGLFAGYCERYQLDLAAEGRAYKQAADAARARGGGVATNDGFKRWLERRSKEELKKRKAA
jgi:hypothetical protein